MDVVVFFSSELRRLGVDLLLGSTFDGALLESLHPDAVVLATGSLPDMPILKGLYTTSMQLCTVSEVLGGAVVPGQRVIVWGGNQAGLVLADYLSESGKTVTVLHRKAHFGEEMSANDRYYLRERLNKGAVTLYKGVRVSRFLSDGVTFRSTVGEVTLTEYESVVLADSFAPVRQDANVVRQFGLDPVFIGDAKQPRHVMYAIGEGEEVGREL